MLPMNDTSRRACYSTAFPRLDYPQSGNLSGAALDTSLNTVGRICVATSNFLFFEQDSWTHKSRRDEMFIDIRLLTFTAPRSAMYIAPLVSLLLRSLDWFV